MTQGYCSTLCCSGRLRRPLSANVKPTNMSLRRMSLIAVIVAIVAVLFATWLTSGQLAPVGGKPLLIGALAVVPFVVAAKNDIDGAGAFALAFIAYFAIAFTVIWLAFRTRHVPRDGK